jgi:hypothetical protein
MKLYYSNLLYRMTPKHSNLTDWEKRHLHAVVSPLEGFEQALVELFSGWLRYSQAVAHRYDGRIGDDGVLGPEWGAIGAALRGLLNGETGRLDCGTLDALLADTLREQGFDPDRM